MRVCACACACACVRLDSANTSVMAAPSDTTADVAGLVTDEDGEVNECVCVRVHVRVRVCV